MTTDPACPVAAEEPAAVSVMAPACAEAWESAFDGFIAGATGPTATE